MGLATAYEAAKRGKKVVLFEQFVLFNQSGSSNDLTRMFRTMYTEDYMADFMVETMKKWDVLEHEAAEPLIHRTGLLNFGDKAYDGGPEGTLTGPKANLDRHDMDYKIYETPAAIEEDFPFRNLPSSYEGLWGKDNGCINLPRLLRALHTLGLKHNVLYVERAEVNKIETSTNGVNIHVTVTDAVHGNTTTKYIYHAAKAALTQGTYANKLLKASFNFELNIDIWEMEYGYYSLPEDVNFKSMWFQFLDGPKDQPEVSNLVYGFPALPWGPPNLCRIAIDNAVRVIKDPSERKLTAAPCDLRQVERFLKNHLPQAILQPNFTGVCLQGNLPDNGYALGYLPARFAPNGGNENIVIFTCGWAMKAVPMIGYLINQLFEHKLAESDPYLNEIVNTHFAVDLPGRVKETTFKEKVVQKIKKRGFGSSVRRSVSVSGNDDDNHVTDLRGELAKRLRTMAAAASTGGVIPRHLTHRSVTLPRNPKDAVTLPAGFKVGIIGAGMSGLYSAMLLKSLGIDYEILEANHERVGGRIYTYRFNPDKWVNSQPGQNDFYDYIDVGAMRFPPIANMDRVIGKVQPWSLVNVCNTAWRNKKRLGKIVNLIPYVLSDKNNLKSYNGKTITVEDLDTAVKEKKGDPFDFSGVTSVPKAFTEKNDYYDWLGQAVSPIVTALEEDFEKGFELLLKTDRYSTRQYLATQVPYPNQTDPETNEKYSCLDGLPASVIDWCETRETGTNLFDEAFSETCIDNFDFNASGQWQCVEGGMDRFIAGMMNYLELPTTDPYDVTALSNTNIKTGVRVTAIREHQAEEKMSIDFHSVTEHGAVPITRTFNHVINTAALGATRMMDLSQCALPPKFNQALRVLHYDYSVKVCLRFKKRFWQHDHIGPDDKLIKGMKGGVTSVDSPLRNVVYPSYGLDLPDAPGVIIASYTWAQDATRMGAAFTGTGGSRDHIENVQVAKQREEAIQTILKLLGDIHGHNLVNSEYDHQYFVMDWYHDPYTLGAFALYGPSQFSEFFGVITSDAANGKLHFAGEACSAHHAWIIGSLNSAYRTVYEVLRYEKRPDLQLKLIELWGFVDEVDYSDLEENATFKQFKKRADLRDFLQEGKKAIRGWFNKHA